MRTFTDARRVLALNEQYRIFVTDNWVRGDSTEPIIELWGRMVPIDGIIAEQIMAFRERRLTAILEELRSLGIDTAEMEDDAKVWLEIHRARQAAA